MEKIKREEILTRLRANGKLLKELKVNSLSIFGSAARGDLQMESDVDLLIDFSEPVGLFHFARTQRELERLLGRQVDLVHREALRPEFRNRVLEELVNV